ncbi:MULTISPECIES: hypothetical protein [unclassified Nocardioides]|uniref:hypothetical protein n=1 Tax=unclassified Nocardioides TaxID=2615069 RepID=UPI0006F52094|nr:MULTISPECIES: hypothetical protein [unclassified Nocardioides]KRA29589.1 hypothetical protein ASD81_21715 [Nocardioides sp. Root614]KRA88236.1 hypothetical protein ASD84_19900 [Nocardioides sp. Root682]
MTLPLRIRFSLGLAIGFLALGLLLLVWGLLNDRIPNAVLGAMFLVLGGLQYTGVAIIVGVNEVQVKSALRTTARRVPIEGLADLKIDGLALLRASDDLRITSLSGVAARTSDVETLREAIAAAGGTA